MACGAISELLRRSLAPAAEISAARHPRKTLADLSIFLKNNIQAQAAGQDIVDFSSRPFPAPDPALRRARERRMISPTESRLRSKSQRDLASENERFSNGRRPMQLRRSTLTLPEPSKLVVACHCLDCQRRTGAPFGVGAFYPVDVVAISGTRKEFTRDAASGGSPQLFLSKLRVNDLLEGRQPTVADRRCNRRAGGPKIPGARQIGLSSRK